MKAIEANHKPEHKPNQLELGVEILYGFIPLGFPKDYLLTALNAAEVYKSYVDTHGNKDFERLKNKCYSLEIIHRAPEKYWPFLVKQMLAENWNRKKAREASKVLWDLNGVEIFEVVKGDLK